MKVLKLSTCMSKCYLSTTLIAVMIYKCFKLHPSYFEMVVNVLYIDTDNTSRIIGISIFLFKDQNLVCITLATWQVLPVLPFSNF